MHVFVNDWDINNWNMLMYIGNWQPKFRGHHFKGKNQSYTDGNLFWILVKNTVQVQGGLMNVFSGQSALQHEFGYNLGRFMSKFVPRGRRVLVYLKFRFGNDTRIYHRNTNTSIQRCLESTNGSFRFGFDIKSSPIIFLVEIQTFRSILTILRNHKKMLIPILHWKVIIRYIKMIKVSIVIIYSPYHGKDR